MTDAVVTAPLALAAIFMLSGIAKLRHPGSTQSVTRLLRLPRLVRTRWFAAALPIGEIGLALILLSPLSTVFSVASVICLLLCLSYWGIIARAMTFSPRPKCGCFWRIGDQRVNGKTLVRNTLLIILASLSIFMAASGATVASDLRGDSLWWLLAEALVVTLTILIGAQPAGASAGSPASVVPNQPDRQHLILTPSPQGAPHELTLGDGSEPDGSGFGAPIPPATVQMPNQSMASLHELVATRAQLIIGIDCACDSTREAAEHFASWCAALPELDVRVLTPLPKPSADRIISTAFGQRPLYDHDSMTWHRLGLGGSPSAILLGTRGSILATPVSGVDAIVRLVDGIRQKLDASKGRPATGGFAQDNFHIPT